MATIFLNCYICGKQIRLTDFEQTRYKDLSKKTCGRVCYTERLRREGHWNSGLKWEQMYGLETLEKVRKLNTRKGKDNPAYGKPRPDTTRRNILDNPLYSEKRKETIRNMIAEFGTEKAIKILEEQIIADKRRYQRVAYYHYGKNCLNCGRSSEEMQVGVHHIDKNRKNNDHLNLIVLCNACHVAFEKKPFDCYAMIKKKLDEKKVEKEKQTIPNHILDFSDI